MKLEIDWLEMAKAVAKAIWPFVAGAFGGLDSSPAAPSAASDPSSPDLVHTILRTSPQLLLH